MEKQEAGSGCDLKERCGFYCAYVQENAGARKALIERFCNGSEYPLCARRRYFFETGLCAPLEMTPLGRLPKETLEAPSNEG